MTSLIPADSPWLIWTVLLGAAAFGVWSERTRWGARLSGCLVTMGVTFSRAKVVESTPAGSFGKACPDSRRRTSAMRASSIVRFPFLRQVRKSSPGQPLNS